MTINPAQHTFHLPEQYKILNLALDFFNKTPCYQLPPSPFLGTGVYALYYIGDFEPYARLASRNRANCDYPIYVGKAVAQGWRTGRESGAEGNELANRLREHARSIRQTTSLRVEDFKCRFMILTGDEASIITSVEAALTRKFRPLWNSIIDGFGNHDPGSGRYDQAISEWDALHPGRSWVQKLTGARPTSDSVIAKTRQHLELQHALPDDVLEAADNPDDSTLRE